MPYLLADESTNFSEGCHSIRINIAHWIIEGIII